MASDVTFDELNNLAGELLPERTVLSAGLPTDGGNDGLTGVVNPLLGGLKL